MIKDLYIFGSSGFAKEVFFLVNDINTNKPQYNVKGFIDISPGKKHVQIGKSNVEVYDETVFFDSGLAEDACFALGMGNPGILKKIKDRYGKKFEFPNLIHPNFVGHLENIRLGYGNIITAGCIFTTEIDIGTLNLFNLNTTLGHDSIIGSCNVFNPGVNISGGVNFGNENLFGTGATILQYIKVGSGNIIGAGALINKDIEDRSMVVGVPGKKIKEL